MSLNISWEQDKEKNVIIWIRQGLEECVQSLDHSSRKGVLMGHHSTGAMGSLYDIIEWNSKRYPTAAQKGNTHQIHKPYSLCLVLK